MKLPGDAKPFSTLLRQTGATFGWITYFLGLIFTLILLPIGYQTTFTNWQVNASAPAVSRWIDFIDYAVLVYGLTLSVSFIFVFTSIVLLYTIVLPCQPGKEIAFLSSLMLVTLPQLILINQEEINLFTNKSLNTFLTNLHLIIGMVGLLLFISFYFLFPSGIHQKKWIRWVISIQTLSIIILVFSQILDLTDDIWLGFVFILVISCISGSIFQIIRVFRTTDQSTRNQSRWVVLSLVIFPFTLFTSFLGESNLSHFISIFVRIFLLGLLPLTLLYSVLFTGLWDARIPFRKNRVMGITVLILFLPIVGAFLTDRILNPPYPTLVIDPIKTSSSPLSIIIDTDMAPDDWMAILYLLKRSDVDIKAISVTGTGEAHCIPGVRNVLKLIRMAGKENIPVACGRETPLQGRNAFPTSWRETADAMLGLDLPEAKNPSSSQNAISLITQTIQSQQEPVSILALGPLTNLAEMIQAGTLLKEDVQQVVIMGGALEVPGNISSSGMGTNWQAEWNMFVDPFAAKIVLESGLPIILVPLDATNQVVLDQTFYRWLTQNHNTPAAKFVLAFISSNVSRVLSGNYYFWDPLAAAILVDPSLAEYESRILSVITETRPDQGDLVKMETGLPVRFAHTVDRQRFYQDFLTALNQP